MDQTQLRDLLVQHLAAGSTSPDLLLPALRALVPAATARPAVETLHEALGAEPGQTFAQLRRQLEEALVAKAKEVHRLRQSGAQTPDSLTAEFEGFEVAEHPPWQTQASGMAALAELLALQQDSRFLAGLETPLAEISNLLEERRRAGLARLAELPLPWQHPGLQKLAAKLAEAEGSSEFGDLLRQKVAEAGRQEGEAAELGRLESEFAAAATRSEKKQVLRRVLAWPTDMAAATLTRLCQESWAQLQAAVTLTQRFAPPGCQALEDFQAWLQRQGLAGAELTRLLWAMRERLEEVPTKVAFLERWRGQISTAEAALLMGTGPEPVRPEAPTAEPPPPETEEPLPIDELELPEPADEPRRPKKVKGPSFWQDHLQPFFLDNWYIFAAILMLVVGSSLVAYHTWDEHWLVRYTILPALLGGFTWTLAWLGTWLERKEGEFRGTAAILRAAAIGLLPVNFMTVAFLADDPQVEGRLLILLPVAALYLCLFGWGLSKWCRAVHAGIGWTLGLALLLLNALVVLRPLAAGVLAENEETLNLLVGSGMHLGFLALAYVVVQFTRSILDEELAREKRVPWFVGGTLAVTWLQVFAWVHTSLGRLPQPHTYAPMVILAGGLLLYVERRALQLQGTSQKLGGESFLGFALILLGCLMGQTQAEVRILCLLLAGTTWLYQASGRRHPLHNWIGLTFLCLGVASVGLLDFYPGAWRPALGILLALGLGSMGHALSGRGSRELADTCRRMRHVVLFLTAAVAMLGQWHDQSEPLLCAGFLLAVAATLSWHAHHQDRLQLLHLAMVVLALTLPYLGCIDLKGQSLHGNTMVFGLSVLSILWLGRTWLLPTKLTLQARSTVLWTYGSLAVAGMVLRVLIERGTPGDALWYQQAMDYAGPLLMAGVLVFATYLSRSLVPAGMAAVIVIILFPELKARFEETFSNLGWGSGLGSANSALGLCLLCFGLRRWQFLQAMGEGDRFLGKVDFPLRRYDHSLFTWPLMASVLFLLLRTETWTLARNLLADGVGIKTALALCITGVAWTFVSIYHRRHRAAVAATHLSWIWFGIGIAFVHATLVEDPYWQLPVLVTALVLQALYFLYRFGLERRWEWLHALLTEPTASVLSIGSLVFTAISLHFLWKDPDLPHSLPLAVFLLAQLLWHGLWRKRHLYAAFLFPLALTLLLAASTSGTGDLFPRLSVGESYQPTLWFLLAVQLFQLLLEFRPALLERLRPLTLPFQLGSILVALILLGQWCFHLVLPPNLAPLQQGLLLVLLFLLARANASGPLALLALLAGYLFFCSRTSFEELPSLNRLGYLLSPWRVSLLSLCMALACAGGSYLHRTWPRLLVGNSPLPLRTGSALPWILGPVLGFAIFSGLLHAAAPGARNETVQLWTPYLGALALAVATWTWRQYWICFVSAGLLTLGNVQVVRHLAGSYLIERGLSEIHLICLGLAASLLLGFVLRLASPNPKLQRGIDLGSMVLAGLALFLLSANYLVRHSLQDISYVRFLISGAIAYLAGLAFRHVARRDARHVDLCEAAYHFGVAMALWCAALLIEGLRRPELALLALSLPVYYFALRAELLFSSAPQMARRYRNSAAVLGLLLLGLYVFRGVFQMVLFPESLVQTAHYHTNSPFVLLLGLILLRLHRQGSGHWLAMYGGLALMLGSYFAVSAFPSLSPFEHPVAGAWCAILIGHFWTALSHQRSPLRTGIQRLGDIDEENWQELRRGWGLCLLAATQFAVLFGVLRYDIQPLAVAPLLLGAGSVWLHHGLLRRSVVYLALAGVLVFLALHGDFFVQSYLQRQHAIWAMLSLWSLALAVMWTPRVRSRAARLGTLSALLAAVVLGHILYHHPGSTVGLWAMALLGCLAALTPTRRAESQGAEERVTALLLLPIPTWLAFFGPSELVPAVLAAIAVALLTGGFGWLCQQRLGDWISAHGQRSPCLLHQILHWLRECGDRFCNLTMVVGFGAAVALAVWHHGQALGEGEIVTLCAIFAALAAGWFFQSQARKSMLAFVLMELAILAFFLAARRQLMLTTDFWTFEYDVWASLVVSFALAGAKQVFDLRPREVGVPVTTTLLVMPVVAMAWTLFHGLGTNVALMVVGMNSLIFAFLGKDQKDSPYNVLAVAGFAAFVLTIFWQKLELHFVHAYVLPVGIAILVLLQLFRAHLSAELRNKVRMVTVLSMLGSAGYYALADARYPVAFNLTLLLLCLLAMGLGGFLRIRMYLSLGFAGVLVSLGSIVFRSFAGLERSPRMTAVGLLILVLGSGLIVGALYYKTHKESLNARIQGWRQRLGEWE